MSWINAEVMPIQVSDNEWWLQDTENGATVAMSHPIEGGLWRGEINKKLCGELMNFLAVNSPTPQEALLGVFSVNIRAAGDIVRELKGIDRRIEPAGFEGAGDVMAETAAI